MKRKHTFFGLIGGFVLILIGGLLTLPQASFLTVVGIVIIILGVVILLAASLSQEFRL